tara:strand:- start:189 stop:968 length:780 start_codon:yes stop_codon:yes gene_type:complete
MERALRIMLKNKMGCQKLTFKELYDRTGNTLVVCATNLQKHTETFFNWKDHENLDIIDAVLMSLAIPILFIPRKFNDEIYVDGGVLCHYPIEYIEQANINIDETLGFVIVPECYMCKQDICEKDIDRKTNIDSFESFIFNIIGCSMIKNLKYVYEKYKDNTIIIINNKNGLNFIVSKEMKEEYILEAYNSTKTFFDKKLEKLESNPHEEIKDELEESNNEDVNLSESSKSIIEKEPPHNEDEDDDEDKNSSSIEIINEK